jgi:cell wall hydrolase
VDQVNDFDDVMLGKKTAASKSYDPVDAAIRTIYGEVLPNATREERQAVAAVIANRAKASGKRFDEVVMEPGQFEPWSDAKARARLEALTPDDPTYKSIAADVADVLGGKANPYPELTHFYAPDAQAKLGRKAPDWAKGEGTRIGSHLFYAVSDTPDNGGDFDAAMGVGTAKTASAAPASDTDAWFKKVYGDLNRFGDQPQMIGEPVPAPITKLNPEQRAKYDVAPNNPNKPLGSAQNPIWAVNNETIEEQYRGTKPGTFFRDLNGKLHYNKTGDEKEGLVEGSLGGLVAGLEGAGASLMNLYPGQQDSALNNALKWDREIYEAQPHGIPSAISKFVGEVGPATAAIVGTEGAAAPMLARSGIGRFLLGTAGQGAPISAVNLGLRGASMGASGALEGMMGSALTNEVSDQPLAQQMGTGALLGGLLKPVGGAVAGGIERFVGGPIMRGAAPAAEQQAMMDKAASLPVPVSLSMGQASRAPAAQAAENAILRGSEGDAAAQLVKGFQAEQQGALRGNAKAISDIMAKREIAPGEGARAVSDKLNAMRDATKKEVDVAYDAARARGEDAMLATASEVRTGMLEGLRAEYDLDRIKSVAGEIERFGEKGAPTARELFETRTRLTNLSQSADDVEAGAARKARSALDAYTQKALENDLFLGDPEAIKAWRAAIGKRAEMGRIFEGNDLVEMLTAREPRSGQVQLKVDPEQAANSIFGRADLGWVGKKNLGRDLARLRSVLGPESEEWNGLRAEVFGRVARAGEGVPEGGVPQFSGQKFMKAWEKAKRDDPQVMNLMFTPEERGIIDKLAEVAQVATTPVKGGDNPSNSAVFAKKLIEPLMGFLSVGGGAGTGAAVGGIPGAAVGALFGGMMKNMKEVLAVGKARKLTYGAKVVEDPSLKNPFIPGAVAPVVGSALANSFIPSN